MDDIARFYRQPSPTSGLGRHRDRVELDESLDVLARLAAAAESGEDLVTCFDRYPEFQPPAGAVAR